MKRPITFLSIALMVCITFPFAACNNASEEQGEVVPRTVVLADFESFDDIYNTRDVVSNYSFTGYFTRTEDENENAIDGHSLEVYIEGTSAQSWVDYAQDGGFPAFLYYDIWSNTKNGGNWGFEWKYLSEISVDIYNPNDFPIDVTLFQLTSDYYPYNNGFITVQAGMTETLSVNVNRYFMQNEMSKKLSYITLLVDYDKTVGANGDLYWQPAYVYFDNLRVEVNENSVVDENGATVVNKKLSSAEEILSFSDEADLGYVRETGRSYVTETENANNGYTYAWMLGVGSSVSHNTNRKFVKEGSEGSLKWTVNPTFLTKYMGSNFRYLTERNFYDDLAWTGFTVCGEYLNWYNFTGLASGNYKILVDVYNAGDYDKEVAFGIHDYNGISKEIKYEYPYNYGSQIPTDTWYKLKAGEWTTLEISDFSYLDLSSGLARLRLTTSLLDVSEPMSFYVNNMRIVKGDAV